MSTEIDYIKMCKVAGAAIAYASLTCSEAAHELYMANADTDFEKLYYYLINQVEDILNSLISGQQSCEEIYLEYTEDKDA